MVRQYHVTVSFTGVQAHALAKTMKCQAPAGTLHSVAVVYMPHGAHTSNCRQLLVCNPSPPLDPLPHTKTDTHSTPVFHTNTHLCRQFWGEQRQVAQDGPCSRLQQRGGRDVTQ
jgi:hypothetical protein